MSKHSAGSVLEVALVFLKLGLTSFGGPVAHVGYFRDELVEKRRWLDDGSFAQLFALCQLLPGPASSQLGFSLGLLRAGGFGAVAAFVAFTAPSAILLLLFASWIPHLEGATGQALIHGLKIVALAIVANAVLGMSRKLCPDRPRAALTALSASVVLVADSLWIQLALIAAGAVAGQVLCPGVVQDTVHKPPSIHGPKTGLVLVALFLVVLLLLPTVTGAFAYGPVVDGFYRAGALVFGGGHVVLPFLEQTVVDPGWLTRDEFLAGYGAAQAVPGPMFSLSAFLGARLPGGARWSPGCDRRPFFAFFARLPSRSGCLAVVAAFGGASGGRSGVGRYGGGRLGDSGGSSLRSRLDGCRRRADRCGGSPRRLHPGSVVEGAGLGDRPLVCGRHRYSASGRFLTQERENGTRRSASRSSCNCRASEGPGRSVDGGFLGQNLAHFVAATLVVGHLGLHFGVVGLQGVVATDLADVGEGDGAPNKVAGGRHEVVNGLLFDGNEREAVFLQVAQHAIDGAVVIAGVHGVGEVENRGRRQGGGGNGNEDEESNKRALDVSHWGISKYLEGIKPGISSERMAFEGFG